MSQMSQMSHVSQSDVIGQAADDVGDAMDGVIGLSVGWIQAVGESVGWIEIWWDILLLVILWLDSSDLRFCPGVSVMMNGLLKLGSLIMG